jgi:hypothetical protein
MCMAARYVFGPKESAGSAFTSADIMNGFR